VLGLALSFGVRVSIRVMGYCYS